MKPVTCGRCGASLAKVLGHDERWDDHPGVWVGFLECPACGAAYIYMRPSAPPKPPTRNRWLFEMGAGE